MVASYECGVLRADAREVELAGNQRRELDHRLVDHDDDEPIDVRRAAQVSRKIGTPRKYPAAVRLVRHESEGTVANRMRVPGGTSQPGVRHAIEQVRRQDCQIGEYVRQVRCAARSRGSGEAQLDRRIVQRGDGVQRLQLRKPRIAGHGISRGVQRPNDVLRRRTRTVVPVHVSPQPEGQRSTAV